MYAPHPLLPLVARLDSLLTGRPETETLVTANRQQHLLDPEAFLTMSDAYYLSDGGYSRILADDETGRLRLSGVSRREVAEMWDTVAVRDARARVEAILRDRLREEGLPASDEAVLPGAARP
jgi:hypothetical protein